MSQSSPVRFFTTDAQGRAPVCEEFKPLVKGASLRGFARVRFGSGLVISDIAIHRQGDSEWASPPSRPMVGADGSVLKDAKGKVRYQALITFETPAHRALWTRVVLAAVRAAAYPDALPDEGERS
jgi:hypothetical protein